MIILYAYNIVRNMERTFDTNIRASLSELITRARSVNNQQDIIIDEVEFRFGKREQNFFNTSHPP